MEEPRYQCKRCFCVKATEEEFRHGCPNCNDKRQPLDLDEFRRSTAAARDPGEGVYATPTFRKKK